jgi:hypothetical protein
MDVDRPTKNKMLRILLRRRDEMLLKDWWEVGRGEAGGVPGRRL